MTIEQHHHPFVMEAIARFSRLPLSEREDLVQDVYLALLSANEPPAGSDVRAYIVSMSRLAIQASCKEYVKHTKRIPEPVNPDEIFLKDLEPYVSELDPADQSLIRGRFGGASLRSLASKHGLSQLEVRMKITELIETLRGLLHVEKGTA